MRRKKQKDRKQFYGRLKERLSHRDTGRQHRPNEWEDKGGPLAEENEGGIIKDQR